MADRPLCSVSIDLDPLRCYFQIHRLGAEPVDRRHVILRRALPRFAEVFAARGVRSTLFAVGRCLEEDAEGREILRQMHADGHEVGNHSHGHPYHLARLPSADAAREIGDAHRVIAEAMGEAPVGFRAPGYDLSSSMLSALVAQGYRYDASIFPAPPYYVAKALVMGAMALRGRPSGSVMGDPRALLAPLDPYRPRVDAPWRRGDAPLVELPVAVVEVLRVPMIGTTLLLAPPSLRRLMLRTMAGRPHFNLELHGIDLCDAREDGIPDGLVARQPDLRVGGAVKRASLESLLDELAETHEIVPLREAAERLSPSL